MKKRKSRRDKAKHPNLQPKFSPRIRQEFIDYDYIDKLSEKDKDWLDKFTGEYHGASFKHDGTDIQDYNQVIGKTKDGKDLTYGKDCNDRNNHANGDMYGILRNGSQASKKLLVDYESITGDLENPIKIGGDPKHMENSYVDFIDSKELEELEKFAVELDALEDHAEYLDTVNEKDEPLPESSQDSQPLPKSPQKS